MLGSNHDGILKIGFLEVVGNAMVVDLKKYCYGREIKWDFWESDLSFV